MGRVPWEEGKLNIAEYLFFLLLFPLALLPVRGQVFLVFILALYLLTQKKPKLDRFFVLMTAWCLIYLVSVLINLHRSDLEKGSVSMAFFTLGLNFAALLFYIHYRSINLNLTRVGRYAFWNLLILIVLALIYILFPSSHAWSILGRSMSEYDILSGNVYGDRFSGFLGSTYNVIFYVFFNFPLSVYYIEKRMRKRYQVIYAALIFIVVRAAATRAGFLLYTVLFIFFVAVQLSDRIQAFRKKRPAVSAAIAVTAGIAVIIGLIALSRFLFFLRPTSNSGRLELYRESLKEVLTRSPLIGMGPDSLSRDAEGAHSAYLKVLYRTGIIGVVVYALALAFRLRDLFRDKVITKQRIVYICCILETLMLMAVEDVDRSSWTICFFYIMVAIFDRISQPVETLAIKPHLCIAMLGQKHIRYREGGVEVVVAELSTRMVKLGHKVTCYDRGGHHVSGRSYDSRKKDNYQGVIVKQVPTINRKGLAAFSSAFFAAVEASFSDADVIHFHAEGPCVMMWLPKLFGKCCVCTIHGIDWQRAKWKGIARKVIRQGEKTAVHYADEIIVLSRSAQEYFWNTYHRKTVLLPNGISEPEPKEILEIREKYGLEERKYILFLGRIVPEKGVHYLIHAFLKLHTDMKLVIAGGSSDTMEYMEKINEMVKSDPRIILTGFVSGRPMQELYSNAYLYVLPSDLEGMPLTILEAMSYGNCCLVSDIPECADVIGDAGVTFRHGDEKNLQNKMQELLDHPEEVKAYGKKAVSRIRAGYSWDEVTEKTIQVYRGTLDKVHEQDQINKELDGTLS